MTETLSTRKQVSVLIDEAICRHVLSWLYTQEEEGTLKPCDELDALENTLIALIEARDGRFHGEGWYAFRQIDANGPRCPEAPEAVWVETEHAFRDLAAVPMGHRSEVSYLGSGDVPDAPARVAERFIASFTPEQRCAYTRLMAE